MEQAGRPSGVGAPGGEEPPVGGERAGGGRPVLRRTVAPVGVALAAFTVVLFAAGAGGATVAEGTGEPGALGGQSILQVGPAPLQLAHRLREAAVDLAVDALPEELRAALRLVG
ncbi:hypothetical protein [Allostreptomyces psammosilenae]|uniref:Uncharacterized protein n=1 Tax=Allostreptomyces psammosilenae TaxID=1892865 RepID=A0A852ZYH4_9ACTN|nr:hypothetical protein [Allostreptomyces psammosilenae]NYI03332.1 hypothetical protein [Allostreptomyces psammosilenae]